ncbi:MAG: tRNA (adenosine(37)-N6)-dimethylallyltransferase MiaA [Rickettsiaceae bacterium H1]|nr:tRNA (adenosine(37)-N6)-dimethylallyltransferase MiaA [Rickettsiaceae bacterium H1]
MLQEGKLLIIAGPTATGKSDVVLRIAEEKDVVVINGDSKQVYKEIPIITAQPYILCDDSIHYLYGYISISSSYSVKMWLEDVYSIINSAWSKHKTVIITGGTGMYLYVLLNGLSKQEIDYDLRFKLEKQLRYLGNYKFYKMLKSYGVNITNIHYNDSYRLIRVYEKFLSQQNTNLVGKGYVNVFKNALTYVLMPERNIIYNNINRRFINMLKLGVIDEVKSIQNNFSDDLPAVKACGVIEILKYLNHSISLSSLIEEATHNTRKYAKRQTTWFRNRCKNAKFFDNSQSLLKACLQV